MSPVSTFANSSDLTMLVNVIFFIRNMDNFRLTNVFSDNSEIMTFGSTDQLFLSGAENNRSDFSDINGGLCCGKQ